MATDRDRDKRLIIDHLRGTAEGAVYPGVRFLVGDDALADTGQALVFKGTFRGQTVAIKLFFSHTVEGFEREAAIFKDLPRHPNVITLLEAFKMPWPCLITPFQAKGSLGDRTRRRGPLPAVEARAMALDIARGWQHLHSNNVQHSDLKCDNVLLGDDDSPKLIDMGFASLHPPRPASGSAGAGGRREGARRSRTIETLEGIAGTPGFVPPELYSSGLRTSGFAIDIYAFGMVIYELLAGKFPFDKLTEDEIKIETLKGNRPELDPMWPSDLRGLMQDCWRQRATERPTVEEVVARLGGGGSISSSRRTSRPGPALAPIREATVDPDQILRCLAGADYDGVSRLLASTFSSDGVIGRIRQLMSLTYVDLYPGSRTAGTERSLVRDDGWVSNQLEKARMAARPHFLQMEYDGTYAGGYGARIKAAGGRLDDVQFLRELLLHATTANVIYDYTNQRIGICSGAPLGIIYQTPSGPVTRVDLKTGRPAYRTLLRSQQSLSRGWVSGGSFRFEG